MGILRHHAHKIILLVLAFVIIGSVYPLEMNLWIALTTLTLVIVLLLTSFALMKLHSRKICEICIRNLKQGITNDKGQKPKTSNQLPETRNHFVTLHLEIQTYENCKH